MTTQAAFVIRPAGPSMLLAAPSRESVKAWMWIVSRGTVSVEKGDRIQSFDLDAEATDIPAMRITWDDFKESMARWFDGPSTRPQLQRVHRDEGHGYGQATGELRFMTGRQAIARGVPADAVPPDALDRESMFAEVEITDPATIEQYRNGQLKTSSPYIHFGFLADDAAETGERWPAVILELSLTANSVQKARQIPIDALAGVALSQSTTPATEPQMDPNANAEAAGTEAAPDADRMASIEESIAALSAQVEALAAQVAAMADKGEEVAMADEPAMGDDEEIVKLSRERDAAVERANDLAVQLARVHAERDLAPFNLADDEKEQWIALALESPKGFKLAMAARPAPPNRQVEAPPVASNPAPDAPAVKLSHADRHEAALRVKAESGCTYTEALARVTESFGPAFAH